MNAHREIVKPTGRFIRLELPEGFELSGEVEVIVFPFNEPTMTKKPKNDLRRFRGAFAHLSTEEKQEMEDFFKNIRN